MNLASEIERNVAAALAEDLGDCDWTAQLTPETTGRASVICRSAAVIAGGPWFEAVFRKLDPKVNITWQIGDGQKAAAGARICSIEGSSRALLTGERTALNFL